MFIIGHTFYEYISRIAITNTFSPRLWIRSTFGRPKIRFRARPSSRRPSCYWQLLFELNRFYLWAPVYAFTHKPRGWLANISTNKNCPQNKILPAFWVYMSVGFFSTFSAFGLTSSVVSVLRFFTIFSVFLAKIKCSIYSFRWSFAPRNSIPSRPFGFLAKIKCSICVFITFYHTASAASEKGHSEWPEWENR